MRGAYVFGYIRGTGAGSRPQPLHRWLLGLGPGDPRRVDHRNGDGLDCRRHNLRITDAAGNSANQAVESHRGASRFRGVSFHRQTGRWVAAQQHRGTRHHIGLFPTEEAAAAALARFREENGLPAWR